MKYGLLLALLAFLSCSKDTTPNVPTSALKGKWVEVETRTDTLSFELMGDMEIMNLNRGKEIRDGGLLPKYKSGPYIYELKVEQIALNWLVSSDSRFNDYYFKINGSTLTIGNFYGSPSGEILTFERLD